MMDESEIPSNVRLSWARLSCGRRHLVKFPNKVDPPVGDEYWCARCGTMETIAEVIPREDLRIVTCDRKDFNRGYGVADLRARRAATTHASGHPEHVVKVINGNGLVLQTSEWEQRSLMDSPDF